MSNEDPAVQRLKKRIEGNKEERARYNRIYEQLQDRTREIVDAKDKWPNAFFCSTCNGDFNARAHKVVRKLPKRMPIAWWVGYCPKKHKCIKRITEKPNDPYYQRSFIIRRDRQRYRDELLTPNDTRFWMLYGHKHGFDHYKSIDKPMTPDELNAERRRLEGR